MINQQKKEMKINESGRWPNIVITISAPEDTANANRELLVDAIESRYDALKEKLVYEGLEKKIGVEEWSALTDDEKYEKMIETKLKIGKLKLEGNYICLCLSQLVET